jgi:predicted DNA-binding ribbon-helix-helix protein
MGAPGRHDRAVLRRVSGDRGMQKYSLRIAGHPTSISLEPEFWAAFGRLAAARGVNTTALIGEIDANRTGNLSSAIRLFVLMELESAVKT